MRTLNTVSDAVLWAENFLLGCGIEEAEREAFLMVSALLGVRPTLLPAHSSRLLPPSCIASLTQWVERRSGREPLQYILGEAEFWGIPFKVTPAVLIPRPETERLVSEGIRALKGRVLPLLLDLATGSGCVAVVLAVEIPDASVFATDISLQALQVAGENARLNGVERRVKFLRGDLFRAVDRIRGMRGLSPNEFDLITVNPPYVKSSEVKNLQPEISLFEPRAALDGGEDGLALVRRIILDAPGYLKGKGVLLLEMGYGQSEDVREIARKAFEKVEIIKDYSGVDRVLRAEKSS